MNRFIRPLAITLALLILVLAAACFAGSLSLHAADTQTETAAEENSGESIEKESSTDYTTIGKAFGAALAIALPAIAGAFFLVIST